MQIIAFTVFPDVYSAIYNTVKSTTHWEHAVTNLEGGGASYTYDAEIANTGSSSPSFFYNNHTSSEEGFSTTGIVDNIPSDTITQTGYGNSYNYTSGSRSLANTRSGGITIEEDSVTGGSLAGDDNDFRVIEFTTGESEQGGTTNYTSHFHYHEGGHSYYAYRYTDSLGDLTIGLNTSMSTSSETGSTISSGYTSVTYTSYDTEESTTVDATYTRSYLETVTAMHFYSLDATGRTQWQNGNAEFENGATYTSIVNAFGSFSQIDSDSQTTSTEAFTVNTVVITDFQSALTYQVYTTFTQTRTTIENTSSFVGTTITDTTRAIFTITYRTSSSTNTSASSSTSFYTTANTLTTINVPYTRSSTYVQTRLNISISPTFAADFQRPLGQVLASSFWAERPDESLLHLSSNATNITITIDNGYYSDNFNQLGNIVTSTVVHPTIRIKDVIVYGSLPSPFPPTTTASFSNVNQPQLVYDTYIMTTESFSAPDFFFEDGVLPFDTIEYVTGFATSVGQQTLPEVSFTGYYDSLSFSTTTSTGGRQTTYRSFIVTDSTGGIQSIRLLTSTTGTIVGLTSEPKMFLSGGDTTETVADTIITSFTAGATSTRTEQVNPVLQRIGLGNILNDVVNQHLHGFVKHDEMDTNGGFQAYSKLQGPSGMTLPLMAQYASQDLYGFAGWDAVSGYWTFTSILSAGNDLGSIGTISFSHNSWTFASSTETSDTTTITESGEILMNGAFANSIIYQKGAFGGFNPNTEANIQILHGKANVLGEQSYYLKHRDTYLYGEGSDNENLNWETKTFDGNISVLNSNKKIVIYNASRFAVATTGGGDAVTNILAAIFVYRGPLRAWNS